jgi:glycosyltransferase involved in cell wall biosynthesis
MAPALRARATANVEFVERVDDEGLRELYRSARAMIYPVDEDFGIVMAEAQACGTPVISIDAGGALDIVGNGVTGWLMRGRGVRDVQRAVRHAAHEDLDAREIRERAERFSSEAYRSALRDAVGEMIEDPCPV